MRVVGERTGMGLAYTMKVFLDFEASSLSDRSYPIEVAWVFEDGRSESHLIEPAQGWDDWDDVAQTVHGIERVKLQTEGTPPHIVANRMVEALTGHDLFASAPSWDGKWLSVLLRGAGLPRHALRLRATDEALREIATDILRPVVPPDRLEVEIHNTIVLATEAKDRQPAHRALADAISEYETWLRAKQAACTLILKLT